MLNWDKFGLKSESKQKSFEDLCMFLCCRELKITKIEAYQNQPGIETEPFEANGKKYGFQTKFFESGFDWEQIVHSIAGSTIKKTKTNKLSTQKSKQEETKSEDYPNNVFARYKLDKVFIYSNIDRTTNSRELTKAENLINVLATHHNAEIEFVTNTTIKQKLNQPANLDLAQLYFGTGDELSFIKNSANPKLLTFIQSSEYIDLPFLNDKKEVEQDISNNIISESSKQFLIIGHPGSGKSIFMHKLLQVFSGLEESDISKMKEVLLKNKALPVLINLKNCVTDSLETILRGRKNDSNVHGQRLNFIYLFDGLDELDEKRADNVLFEIHRLAQQNDTSKIIISCRSGNINRLKTKTYFNNIKECRIADLDNTHIDEFFQRKINQDKKAKLTELKAYNHSLVTEIKDIFLIKLLWDTINELNENSTVIELLSKKIDLLLNDAFHKKSIEALNLPNPKKQAIIELNQDISFEFQKQFQFRFSESKLQDLILKKFERLSYQDANNIINYIADLFFEHSYSEDSYQQQNYIYQHRRYQEYFFTQRLKAKYEEHPRILRQMEVIPNKDYFEDLFLKYLRQEYKKERNLVGLIELNLMNIYLGKDKSYGVETAYYTESSEFIPALVCQELSVFNELIEDENLQIKNKISINFSALNKSFEIWKTDNKDYDALSYLKNVYQRGIASLISHAAQFWKAGKYDIANNFVIELDRVISLYDENKFLDKLGENEHIEDPFWNEFENWLYYLIIIKNENIEKLFNTIIRKNYHSFSDDSYGYKESGRKKLINSFFRVCLSNNKTELFELLDNFSSDEFIKFLSVLKTIEYLPVFIQTQSIHQSIKNFIKSFSAELNKRNFFVLFYKKFFNLSLSDSELAFLNTDFLKLREKRSVDWRIDNAAPDFLLLSYVKDDYSFYSLLRK
jgi:hypothetical protein